MTLDTLIPNIATCFFFVAGLGWLAAVGRSQSRLSRIWYGKKWPERFAPEQKRGTILHGALFGIGYLLLGLSSLLTTLRAAFSAARSWITELQWPVLGLACFCMVAAAIGVIRRSWHE